MGIDNGQEQPRRESYSTTFTTGQLATIFSTSPRTVSKWIDTGLLRAHRLPGCNDRRAHLEDVLIFAETHGMVEYVRRHLIRTLVLCGVSDPLAEGIATRLPDWLVRRSSDLFTAGWEAGVSTFGVVVVDMDTIERYTLLETLRATRNRARTWGWVALIPEDSPDPAALHEAGLMAHVIHPAPTHEVVGAILRWHVPNPAAGVSSRYMDYAKHRNVAPHKIQSKYTLPKGEPQCSSPTLTSGTTASTISGIEVSP